VNVKDTGNGQHHILHPLHALSHLVAHINRESSLHYTDKIYAA